MQSGNGMTMQEARTGNQILSEDFSGSTSVKKEKMLSGHFTSKGKERAKMCRMDVRATVSGRKNGKCENCSSYKALREKKQMIKLEFLESEVYQVISRYMEIDGQPYVMELINHLEDDTLIDISCREKLINKLTGYNEKII